jgi:hypothetical protein
VFERPEDGGRPPWHVFCRAREEGFAEVSAHGSLRVLRREPRGVRPAPAPRTATPRAGRRARRSACAAGR